MIDGVPQHQVESAGACPPERSIAGFRQREPREARRASDDAGGSICGQNSSVQYGTPSTSATEGAAAFNSRDDQIRPAGGRERLLERKRDILAQVVDDRSNQSRGPGDELAVAPYPGFDVAADGAELQPVLAYQVRETLGGADHDVVPVGAQAHPNGDHGLDVASRSKRREHDSHDTGIFGNLREKLCEVSRPAAARPIRFRDAANVMVMLGAALAGCGTSRDDAFDRAMAPTIEQVAVVDSEPFTLEREALQRVQGYRMGIDTRSVHAAAQDLMRRIERLPKPKTTQGLRRSLTLRFLAEYAKRRVGFLELEAQVPGGAPGSQETSSGLDSLRRRHSNLTDLYLVTLINLSVLEQSFAQDSTLKRYLAVRYWTLPDSVVPMPLTRKFYAYVDSLSRRESGRR